MIWDDLFPQVLGYCPLAADMVARRHLVQAAREFCNRTNAWNSTLDVIPTVAEEAEYSISLWPGEELVKILSCEVDGREYVLQDGPIGRARQRRGDGQTITPAGMNFILTPTPIISDLNIYVDVALRPSLDSTSIPTALEAYTDYIADGAIARLLSLPGMEWRDEVTAQRFAGKFEDRISTVASKIALAARRVTPGSGVQWF